MIPVLRPEYENLTLRVHHMKNSAFRLLNPKFTSGYPTITVQVNRFRYITHMLVSAVKCDLKYFCTVCLNVVVAGATRLHAVIAKAVSKILTHYIAVTDCSN